MPRMQGTWYQNAYLCFWKPVIHGKTGWDLGKAPPVHFFLHGMVGMELAPGFSIKILRTMGSFGEVRKNLLC